MQIVLSSRALTRDPEFSLLIFFVLDTGPRRESCYFPRGTLRRYDKQKSLLVKKRSALLLYLANELKSYRAIELLGL